MELQPGDHYYVIERLKVSHVENGWTVFDDGQIMGGVVDEDEQRILSEIYNGNFA